LPDGFDQGFHRGVHQASISLVTRLRARGTICTTYSYLLFADVAPSGIRRQIFGDSLNPVRRNALVGSHPPEQFMPAIEKAADAAIVESSCKIDPATKRRER
jgi:hypothetical protein